MNNISAIIVVKNSPPTLSECVKQALKLCAEIIIIDIGMSPESIKNLHGEKVRIIPHLESVPYVELIREKTKKYAHNEWVLFLDPDEILPDSLIKEIKLKYRDFDFVAFARANYIFGKHIVNSRWWPDYQVRLFKKGALIWPTTIHAQPLTTGNGLTLEAKESLALKHFNYNSVDEFLAKSSRYAKSEAGELAYLDFTAASQKALQELNSRFFLENGYKDGTHGLVLALLQMFYNFSVYAYTWEKAGYPKMESKALIRAPYDFFSQGLAEVAYWTEQKNPHRSFFTKIKTKILIACLKLLK